MPSSSHVSAEDALRILAESRDPRARREAVRYLVDLVDAWGAVPGDLHQRIDALYGAEKDLGVATAMLQARNRLRLKGLGVARPVAAASPGAVDSAVLAEALSRLSALEKESGLDLSPMGDRYADLSMLRSGGMAKVFKARRVADGKPVAMKFLEDSLLGNESVRKRFEREYRLLSTMRHPNVIPVHEYIVGEKSLCYVMDFVDGPDLARWVHENPVDMDRVLEIVNQVCLGLEACHERGIVHRDIKPSNILLGGPEHGNQAMLSDFGLATDVEPSELTQVTTKLGTPGFQSPEQSADPRAAGPASDIFSLGVTIYYALSGGKNPTGDFMRLHELNPDVPEFVSHIVERCLRRRPKNRWADVRQMREAFNEHLMPTVVVNRGIS